MSNLGDAAEIVKSGAVDKIADLIHNLAGPLTEEVGLFMGEKVRAYRVKNMISVFQKTKKMLSGANLPESAVPPRIFLPILDASSLETDESLQYLWAGLLASASQKSDELSPSFIETLNQLTPHEARTLDACYGLVEDIPAFYIWTEDQLKVLLSLDNDAATRFPLTMNAFERLGLFTRVYNLQERKSLLPQLLPIPTMDNYVLPGGITWINTSDWLPGSQSNRTDPELPELTYRLTFTQYGLEFIKACRGPRTAQAEK